MTEQQIYFPLHSKLPQQLLQQVQNLKDSLVAKIQNGEIQVSSKSQKIIKKYQNPKNREDKQSNKQYMKRMKELDVIKQQLANKIKMIDKQQKQIKALTKKIQKQQNKSKLQRSIITQQDRRKIAAIRKQQREFEQSIKKKINNIAERIKQDQKQLQEEKAFKHDLMKKQRVVKLMEKRQKMTESREKTLQILNDSHLSVKSSHYIYKLNELKDKKHEIQNKQATDAILKLKKQKMKTDFNQIREHSIEHKKLIEEKRQIKKFQLRENQLRKRSKTINHQTEFSNKLKEELRIQKIQEMRKLNIKRQLRHKITNFSDYLTQNFKPKITQKSMFVPKKQVQPLQKLTHEQIIKKGQQYLEIGKKKAKKISPQSRIQTETDKDFERLPTSSTQKYPNYLNQLHKNSKQQNLFQRVLKEKKLSTRKIQQVIRWMKNKQQGNYIGHLKGTAKNQITSAFQKLRLLNSLYQTQKNSDL